MNDMTVLNSCLCETLCCFLHPTKVDDEAEDRIFGEIFQGLLNLEFHSLSIPKNLFLATMTEDPLTALQRHFEEQYGKLEVGGSRKKKRKRDHIEVKPQEIVSESEEEWQGIQTVDYSPPTFAPQIVSFTETTEATEEEVASYKSFMVHL